MFVLGTTAALKALWSRAHPPHTATGTSRHSQAGSSRTSGAAIPTPHSLRSRNSALVPCSSGRAVSEHLTVPAGAACSIPPALTELAQTDLFVSGVPGRCCRHPESCQQPTEAVPPHPPSVNTTVIPSHTLTGQTAVTALCASLP